jgi:hypothetical protein
MSNFQLPSIRTQPIIGDLGHPIGSISPIGDIRIDRISGRIGLDGRVFDGDRKIGEIGIIGLRMDCLGPYRTIQNGFRDDYLVR